MNDISRGKTVSYRSETGTRVSVIPAINKPIFNRVAIYCCEDTEKKASKRHLKEQKCECEDYVYTHREYKWILTRTYLDVGPSPGEQFAKMLSDSEIENYDYIVTKTRKLFCPNGADMLSTLKTLNGRRKTVIFIDENLRSDEILKALDDEEISKPDIDKSNE